MRISRVYIKNFRSIEEIDITLQPLCAFIGPNNSGKSNILDAIKLVLGQTYPTIRSFSERDYRNHNQDIDIEIKVWFDSPISDTDAFGTAFDISGFGLILSQYKRRTGTRQKGDPKLDFIAIDEKGQAISKVQKRAESGKRPYAEPVRVSGEMRDTIPLLYIGDDRDAKSQLRPTQWTLLGRIYKELDRRFRIDGTKVQDFTDKIGKAVEILKGADVIKLETFLRESVRKQTGLSNLFLKFDILDPLDHFKTLRPFLRDQANDPDFDPEEMGKGVQSALVVALTEAYRNFVKESAVLLVEEPELFLHPHACRHFYNLLKEIAVNGMQILYTTHNSAFLNIADYESIYLVRKEEGKTKVFTGLARPEGKEMWKAISRFDASLSEVFFAKIIIVVEGPADKIATTKAFELKPYDFDVNGVSTIVAGSKSEIPYLTSIFSNFGIPIFVLCEADTGKTTGEKLTSKIESIIGKERLFVLDQQLEKLLGLSGKLSQAEAIKLFEIDRIWKRYDDILDAFRNLVEDVSSSDKNSALQPGIIA